MTEPMRAITLHQPWASLVAHGVKTVETRSWPPPRAALGRQLAIHAGKRIAPPVALHPDTETAIANLYGERWRHKVPTGAVLAVARLVSAGQVMGVDGEIAVFGSGSVNRIAIDPYGDFGPGRWLWMLEEVEPIEPQTATGAQRLWKWSPSRKLTFIRKLP
jgi:hypothetical protein